MPPGIDLPRTDGENTVDGVLVDDAWRGATQIELGFETQPGENIPARVKTVAYLMEVGSNRYVGFVTSDPDPTKIRAYLRDRDTADNDDLVGIIHEDRLRLEPLIQVSQRSREWGLRPIRPC